MENLGKSMNDIVIYKNGTVSLEITVDNDTVWLSQKQMELLFGRERSVITKHINNVFNEAELEKNAVCANFAHTAEDGKVYDVKYYNLDVIISVGYRVKSKQGTQFRIWATSVLKQHLLKGYTLDQKRLDVLEEKQLLTISDDQYIANIPSLAWNFYIGGYQPAQKWLKDRSGRELSYSDFKHYNKIIVALKETDRVMKEVDNVMDI